MALAMQTALRDAVELRTVEETKTGKKVGLTLPAGEAAQLTESETNNRRQYIYTGPWCTCAKPVTPLQIHVYSLPLAVDNTSYMCPHAYHCEGRGSHTLSSRGYLVILWTGLISREERGVSIPNMDCIRCEVWVSGKKGIRIV